MTARAPLTWGRSSSQSACIFLEFGERLLQPLEGVPHTAFDGVFGRAGDASDLLKGKIGHLAQEKDLALLAGQRIERGHDLELDLVGDGPALGRRARVRIGHLIAQHPDALAPHGEIASGGEEQ